MWTFGLSGSTMRLQPNPRRLFQVIEWLPGASLGAAAVAECHSVRSCHRSA
jgi:hypothetical protein